MMKGFRELVPFFVPDANEVNEGLRVYSSGSEDADRESSEENMLIRVWDREEGFFVDTTTASSPPKRSSEKRRSRNKKKLEMVGKFAGMTFETKVPEPSELPLPKLLKIEAY